MARVFGRVRIYPLRSAMHGAINVWTKRWGYICFKPPTYVYGRWWPWYFYLSPNGTPWGATLILGRDRGMYADRRLARLRRVLWGHGYSTGEHDPQSAQSYLDSIESDLPLPPDRHAPSVEGEREARWEMRCQKCGAEVYLPATANGHDITGITGWSFDTENGWRCYGCTPTPAGSEPEEES